MPISGKPEIGKEGRFCILASALLWAKTGSIGFAMISAPKFFPIALAAALFAAAPAYAQFPFGNRQRDVPPQEMQGDNELSIRVDRLEQQLRQMTGQLEQLQMQNQQLLQQLQRGENPPATQQRPVMRPQQPNMPQQQASPPPMQQQTVPPLGPPQQQQNPNRRGDAFDPDEDPNAPGRPRNLGQIPPQQQNRPQGPMVLSPDQNQSQNQNQNQNLPPPVQNPVPGPQQQAVLPPSSSPKDAYDLAYGYVLRRDYALAEQSFRAFLDQHGSDRNAPLASYWLGESLYQQRKYNDAANVFLDNYKKFPQSQRAPDSLLRLGQSLAQLGNKEGACGSIGAVLSKYPKASANVKKNAEDEQKRLGC
jgi:tol-pal system protein YbgF